MTKVKVPTQVPSLSFTMLKKGYVDLGTELKAALIEVDKFQPYALRPAAPQFFDAYFEGAAISFKIYRSKGKRAHTRLRLEKGRMRELKVVVGDSLYFIFSSDARITLEIDRTGFLYGKDAERFSVGRATTRLSKQVMKRPKGMVNPLPARVVDVKYSRDRRVSDWVIGHADGTCELCNSAGPFRDVIDRLYLEAHHIHFLSKGGPDIVENVVALCPNCHRKCHHSKDTAKIAARLSVVVASRRWD
jgi:5-methylcytosine-specific restriction endonuclease McrA